MALKTDLLALDVLAADPETPAAGELWSSTPLGLGPKASQAAAGFMSLGDKTKLDNMSANGSGDDWVSGLLVEAQPSPDQTVKYTSGTYMVNGVIYTIASGGNYNLANGFGGVNHYTALSASQRAVVLIYVDTAQVIKSVAGASSSSSDPPMPTIPADTVCLAFVLISKHSNGSSKNITPSNITDVRLSRRAHIDESAKISSNDISSGFLRDKLTDNGNVHFTKENADAAESLKADVQFGTSGTTACVGNDARLSDARTPSVHTTSHKHGGADEVATATAGANAIPKANSGGQLAAGWGGAASTLATLNASTKVVEDPANATATPTASKIPIADGTGKLDAGWIPLISGAVGVSEVTDVNTSTTTSTSYVLLDGQTITPGAGTYVIFFSCSVSHSNAAGIVYVSIYVNGVQVAASERRLQLTDIKQISMVVPLATQAIKSNLGAAQAIEVRWKTSGATASCYQKTLTLLKV